MQENFLNSDPDATLVQPRFDEAEAQTARPVVPLARPPVWQSRRLPLALVLVSALLGGLVSVVAYRLYLRPAQMQMATQAQTKTEAETAATPAPQAARTPELTAAVPARDETARAEAPAESKPEERAPTAAETHAAKDEEKAAKDEEKPTRAEANAKRSDDERTAREASAHRDTSRPAREESPRARRVEVIPAYPEADRVGHDRRRDDDGEARDDQPSPEGRGDGRRWGGHRPRRRNIDRIRDIFGAPPPG